MENSKEYKKAKEIDDELLDEETLINILNNSDLFYFWEDLDLTEVAYKNLSYLHNMDELMLSYFDIDSYVKDMKYDGYYNSPFGVIKLDL